jgi:hypothetical protein
MMIVFPNMLVPAAKEAGMPVPENTHDMEYPHFYVYCMLQLCRPVSWGNHWKNAKIIAAVPKEKLMTMTEKDFNKLGFSP